MKKEEIKYLITYYLHLLPLDDKQTINYPHLSEEERALEKAKFAKY